MRVRVRVRVRVRISTGDEALRVLDEHGRVRDPGPYRASSK